MKQAARAKLFAVIAVLCLTSTHAQPLFQRPALPRLPRFGQGIANLRAFLNPAQPVQVIDESGNFIGDLAVDPNGPSAAGVAVQPEDLAGALQKESEAALVSGGRCRQYVGESVPIFDEPADVGEALSSVLVPERGELLSVSVVANVTHERAGSAGLDLLFGNAPNDRPHVELKAACEQDDKCDHFGNDIIDAVFSDQASESFSQNRRDAPFTGEYAPVQPLSLTKVGNGDEAGQGGTFGRFTLRARVPGVADSPKLSWVMQVCYVPTEPAVEAVMDYMQGGEGEIQVAGVGEQQAGAMAASFIRRFTGATPGTLARLSSPQRSFMMYLGRMYVQYALCFGLAEAYEMLKEFYCATFGGYNTWIGIQIVTDPTCPTDFAFGDFFTNVFIALGSY